MSIAIVGCGQLAQMLAEAATAIGEQCVFLASESEQTGCVTGLGRIVRATKGMTAIELFQQLGRPKVITVEKESVDTELLLQLDVFCDVYPSPDTIFIGQHRGREKLALQELGIPVTPYRQVQTLDDVMKCANDFGYPLHIKACESGYDGKNQWLVRRPDDISSLPMASSPMPCVVEPHIPFIKEISFIGARNTKGEIVLYPATENVHQNGTLVCSVAPANDINHPAILEGYQYLTRILSEWQYVGVLAMECFLTESGLLINELAPRVHNSGHWTRRLPEASQFENHIRAILNLPLKTPMPNGSYGMVNILGSQQLPDKLALFRHAEVYRYNKSVKPGRKMGHIEIQGPDGQFVAHAVKTIANCMHRQELANTLADHAQSSAAAE